MRIYLTCAQERFLKDKGLANDIINIAKRFLCAYNREKTDWRLGDQLQNRQRKESVMECFLLLLHLFMLLIQAQGLDNLCCNKASICPYSQEWIPLC